MTQKPNQSQQLQLLLFLLCLGGLLVLVQWASGRNADSYGPLLMAKDSTGRIWVQMNHDFYVLDGEGRLQARINPVQLGVKHPVADICPLPNGDMLVGSRETGTLHFIHADFSGGAVIDPAKAGIPRLFGAFSLYCDPQDNHIYIADTNNHRLLVFSREGELLHKRGSTDGKSGEFNFPNGILLGVRNRLLVVDTNHHQIQVLNPDLTTADKPIKIVREGGYDWPAFAVQDEQGIVYLTVLANGMERGRVHKLNAAGSRIASLPLPRFSEPTALLLHSEEILVADQGFMPEPELFSSDYLKHDPSRMPAHYVIRRFDTQGRSNGSFGDEAFRVELKSATRQKLIYQLLIGGGQLLLIVMLIVLLVTYYSMRKTEERRPLAVEISGKPLSRGHGRSLWTAHTAVGINPTPATPSYPEPLYVILIVAGWCFVASLLFKLPDTIYRIFTHDVAGAPGLLIDVAPAFIISALISLLASSWRTRASVAGRFASTLKKKAETLLRRYGDMVEEIMLPQERIERFVQATDQNFPLLVLVTQIRLLVITINPVGRSVRRVQELPLVAIRGAELRLSQGFNWKWLFGMIQPVELRIGVSNSNRPTTLRIIDGAAARQLQAALGAISAQRNESKLGVRDVGLQAGIQLENGAINPAKSLLLGGLMPGFGHLYQQRLWAGVLWLMLAASSALTLMMVVLTTMRRNAEVHEGALAGCVTTLAVLWLLSMLDVWSYARRWNMQESPGL